MGAGRETHRPRAAESDDGATRADLPCALFGRQPGVRPGALGQWSNQERDEEARHPRAVPWTVQHVREGEHHRFRKALRTCGRVSAAAPPMR